MPPHVDRLKAAAALSIEHLGVALIERPSLNVLSQPKYLVSNAAVIKLLHSTCLRRCHMCHIIVIVRDRCVIIIVRCVMSVGLERNWLILDDSYVLY